MHIVSPARARNREPDEACAQAVELARQAAEEVAGPGMVGEHLAATAEGDRVVTHTFRSLAPAYRGWCWAVTVARASRSKHVTVSETVLIPGAEAVLAPDWVPWRERLLPGDVGVGDVLPAPPDDPRLVPAATLQGDDGLQDWGEAEWALPGAQPEDLVPVAAELAGTELAGAELAGPGLARAELAGPELAGAELAGAEQPLTGPDGGEPPVAGPAAGEPAGAEPRAGEPAAGAQPGGAAAGGAQPGGPQPGATEAGPGAVTTDRESAHRETADRGSTERESTDSETADSETSGTVPVRARVLSAIGRDDAALRWYTSEHGPSSPLAHSAPGLCAGCGFFIRLAGPLGRVFGACGNEYAPDDGRIVSVDHGCGAYSEAVLPAQAEGPGRPVIDELGYDLVDMPGVSVDETVFEPLDHN
jgi:Protein of unknown function (DUF3027)